MLAYLPNLTVFESLFTQVLMRAGEATRMQIKNVLFTYYFRENCFNHVSIDPSSWTS